MTSFVILNGKSGTETGYSKSLLGFLSVLFII